MDRREILGIATRYGAATVSVLVVCGGHKRVRFIYERFVEPQKLVLWPTRLALKDKTRLALRTILTVPFVRNHHFWVLTPFFSCFFASNAFTLLPNRKR